MDRFARNKLALAFVSGFGVLVSPFALSAANKTALQEVIVTAQKRAESLQDTPIAISVLQADQLDSLGVSSLDALNTGLVPSLHSHGYGNSTSTLVLNIRGNGAVDVSPTTREPAVAVYVDGFYLARPQGLSMEVADLERIEVLRGPQGTLFGRNSTSGAVSLITRKPTGELSFEQTLGAGNYDAWRSVTRINLPAVAGVKIKLDYVHNQRDGWVENRTPHQADYNAVQKDGGRLALEYSPSQNLLLDYAYDNGRVVSTQNYFQFKRDYLGAYGAEPDREMKTRTCCLVPLEPTTSSQQGHSLTVAWDASDRLTVKSLTGYRKLGESIHDNFGPVFYYNGPMFEPDIAEDQFSQELQLIGNTDSLTWVAGLYYFRENAREITDTYFTLDQFGLLGNGVNAPIDPPTPINLFTGQPVPERYTEITSKSEAAYGQATWTPPASAGRLHITLGARYTADQKRGKRIESGENRFHFATSHVDPTATVDYAWTDAISTYVKWSSAYHAGGVNPGSEIMTPYTEEKVKTWELGAKSEFFERRFRANAALFSTVYDGMQIDFASPVNPSISETINARKKVHVKGAELEFALVPFRGMVLGLEYTLLIGHMPLQPNPLNNDIPQKFVLTQSPRHAGALTADYTFPASAIGTWALHFDATSSSRYTYAPQGGIYDAYTLFNARVSLADIPLGANNGKLKLSAWCKNLTDAEYVVQGYPVNDPPISITQAFGDPRTFGLDVTYRYH